MYVCMCVCVCVCVCIISPTVPGVTNSVLEVTNNDGGFCNTGTTAQRIWIEPFRLFLCGGQELG